MTKRIRRRIGQAYQKEEDILSEDGDEKYVPGGGGQEKYRR